MQKRLHGSYHTMWSAMYVCKLKGIINIVKIVFISVMSYSYGHVEGKIITLLADHQFILHTIFLP